MRQFHEIDHAEKPELSIVSKESMYAGNPVNTKIISLNQQYAPSRTSRSIFLSRASLTTWTTDF